MKAKIIRFKTGSATVPVAVSGVSPETDCGLSLTVDCSSGEHIEPHGTLQHVAHIPRPGVICQIKLGAAGLQYTRAGVTTHVIPRAELIALFERLEPKFGEAPNGNTRPAAVDALGAPIN